jgi:phenylacetate-CoA ligase
LNGRDFSRKIREFIHRSRLEYVFNHSNDSDMTGSEYDDCAHDSAGLPGRTSPDQIIAMWHDRQLLEKHQFRRLNSLLEKVLRSNSFWQHRLREWSTKCSAVNSIEQLRQLPVTTKQHLVDDHLGNPPYGSNLTFEFNQYARLHQTSGTTGHPIRWLDTVDSWNWFCECWRQIYSLIGLRPDDRLFFPFSFGPFIGFWAAFEGATRLGNLCIPGGGLSSESRLRMIEDNRATLICCTPTYAMRLAEVAVDKGFDIANGPIRGLIVAGEPGGSIPSIRQRIEEAWGARVFDHWGMTEIGSLAVEQEDRPSDLVVLETECIAEIVDPSTLDPVASGEIGELLITNLGRVGSPLIRYRTGDRVRAIPNPDNALLLLQGGILGRADEMVTIRGNNVYPSSVEAILREFDDVAEFQMEVFTERAMQQLAIQVEPVTDCQDVDRLASRIVVVVRERLNFQPLVQLVDVGSLPRFELKGRRFHRR